MYWIHGSFLVYSEMLRFHKAFSHFIIKEKQNSKSFIFLNGHGSKAVFIALLGPFYRNSSKAELDFTVCLFNACLILLIT